MKADLKSHGQMWAEYAMNVKDQMQDTLGDALYDGIKEGFDNIEDLMQDFADSMLRIWTDMIAKMLIKAAISGIAGLVGTPGAAPVIPAGDRMMAHSGGVIGVDNLPRFHRGGLASDEVLAVLKKQEVVFTPGQMKALGKVMSEGGVGGLSLNVPVIVDDPLRQKRLASEMRTEIEAAARRVIRRQMQ
jgi:hypothetical protein